MAVTLQQIADACGVSKVTVSRIISGQGKSHRPETRQRVLMAARRLGYMPNASARAISTGRFGAVAFVLSTRERQSHFTSPLLAGANHALEEHDIHLTLARLPDQQLTDAGFVPKFLRQWMADGLLVNYTHDIPPPMIGLIESHRIPAVWLNVVRQADCVYPDNFAAARDATARLIAIGHRRIAYADFAHGTQELDHVHGSVLLRRAGYETAMREAGLTPRDVRPPMQLMFHDREAMAREILAAPDRPTAFYTYSQSMAIPILLAARSMGLVVPRDLSILTNSSWALLVNCGVNFTATLDPEFELGAASARQLLAKIAAPDVALEPIALPHKFNEGTTSAPPPTM